MPSVIQQVGFLCALISFSVFFFFFFFFFVGVLVFVCHKNNPLHTLKVCLVAPSPAMGASSFKKFLV